jgi:hypothetical protein
MFSDSRVSTPCAPAAAASGPRPISWNHGRDAFGERGRSLLALCAPISSPDQRPPAFRRRWREAARTEGRDISPAEEPGSSPRHARARKGAQRVERVVGHQAAPHEIPQRIDRLRGEASAGSLEDRREKRRAAIAKIFEDRDVAVREI